MYYQFLNQICSLRYDSFKFCIPLKPVIEKDTTKIIIVIFFKICPFEKNIKFKNIIIISKKIVTRIENPKYLFQSV